MGIWVEYEELYNLYGGPLAENSPPTAGVGVILVLIIIGGVLYKFRKSLRLKAAELVFIYTALLVAAPLMTQGLWHRLFGLISGITHEQDFKSYESLPPMLWPHGDNLVPNGRFEKGLDGFVKIGSGPATWQRIEWKGKNWNTPVLANAEGQGSTSLAFTMPRKGADGKDQLVPGENFVFSCLVKADGFQSASSYFVKVQADGGTTRTILISAAATTPTFSIPSGFQRIGVCPFAIPTDLKKDLKFYVGLNGPGTLAVQDIELYNSQAVEGAYMGRFVVREKDWNKLGDHERNFTIMKPDNMMSLGGLKYILTGFIPLDQWKTPAIAWTILIAAIFLGFMGFNIIMRRQWVESERFTFPMNILPRHLFADEEGGAAKALQGIFYNPIMWVGFGVCFVLCMLKGIHYYYPAVPAPVWEEVHTADLVTSPALKAYLGSVWISVIFTLLSVALLVETDILFSVWSTFLLWQLFPLFGKVFTFNKYPGYPWDMGQSGGAFLAFALLAVIVARRHLIDVGKQVLGIGRRKIDDSQELASYRWATVMIIASVAILGCWAVWTKMGLSAGLLYFGLILVCGFTASKVRAECGAPYGYWMPYSGMLFVSALGGYSVFGSTGMVVATMVAGFVFTACFLFIAPVQVEMMELGRAFKVRPRDIGHGLWIGLLGGLFIGGFVLLCWAYGLGADNLSTSWPYNQNWYFSTYREGDLSMDRTVANTGYVAPSLSHLTFNPVGDAANNTSAKGIAIGFTITGLLALLRSLFMWFPIHPIGFVLAPTAFGRYVWFICFLAWAGRSITLKVGGAHTVRRGLVPFCVGMFLACVCSVVVFDIIAMYLRAHGVTSVYSRWP